MSADFATDRDIDRSLAAYDYELPADRIAQNPVVPRDSSRLLVVDAPPQFRHCVFRDLPTLLRSGDLLVLNDTQVIPARLYGHKVDRTKIADGAKVEVLLLEEQKPHCWLALVKPGKRLKPGAKIEFADRLTAQVVAIDTDTGGRLLQFNLPTEQSLLPWLSQRGVVPLPPYITNSEADPEQYQTVYAKRPGSAAAPTAGLHFTPELFDRLQAKGISHVTLTLHVGVGTFRPVESDDITQHKMHGEWLEVSPSVVEAIQQTKANGGRVIAVGTTAVRSLEAAAQTGTLQPYCGKTELFIYPGYQWRVVDGLITNFHLPKSSLMMLVSALIGRQRLLALYQEAIDQHYRFYSFGDAMLILPEATT
ncbi:tRNA preQ1(34) S-adenosylmethionine ribosyltransferase-isomerase QueA [Thermocoleostomius sinensis]|uniref:S-adenosylmethionine:tRNA ribosyltransferase-isomerase n=1 Tax=Thermocoleostomius sinensis A174 TaxID=2016057 RepID=A0A9E8ZGM9_9CYAN|nr:tRNA preQ1(34) S-adenosylmethionine ribosyltransferase-isomerase QueA [Thermocoleostomius sinensis]WAL61437.1 tRNA preQ1(34) S-adenosylmethionine ribosyltransferase-isomerase QueA [Thermocoleostomius sinensis A174]